MNSRAKPLLRGALIFLLFGGLVLMLWPVGQSAYGWWSQRTLRANWEKVVVQTPATASSPQVKSKKSPHKPQKTAHTPKSARPLRYAPFPPTRIVIPEINLDAVVLQGMDLGTLQRGPGHEPASALPGQPGNCVISAHSNIYGSWFGNLDQLWAGSEIQLHTPRQIYTYTVLTSLQVSQTDVSVLNPTTDGTAQLTLITCTKPASMYRQVVTAVLKEEN